MCSRNKRRSSTCSSRSGNRLIRPHTSRAAARKVPRTRSKGTIKGKKNKKDPKKRGRPSIFEVFKSGTRGYVRVRPKKQKLVFRTGTIAPVVKGMQDAFELFAGKCIQNNHSETANNTIRTVSNLGGQRSKEKLDGCIPSVVRLRNDPALIAEIETQAALPCNHLLEKDGRGRFQGRLLQSQHQGGGIGLFRGQNKKRCIIIRG